MWENVGGKCGPKTTRTCDYKHRKTKGQTKASIAWTQSDYETWITTFTAISTAGEFPSFFFNQSGYHPSCRSSNYYFSSSSVSFFFCFLYIQLVWLAPTSPALSHQPIYLTALNLPQRLQSSRSWCKTTFVNFLTFCVSIWRNFWKNNVSQGAQYVGVHTFLCISDRKVQSVMFMFLLRGSRQEQRFHIIVYTCFLSMCVSRPHVCMLSAFHFFDCSVQ